MTELKNDKNAKAFAGWVSICGAISMIIGAIFWGSSGTDLWQTLATGQMQSYLSKLPEVQHLLVINTSFWIMGVLLLATAGTFMSGFCISNLRLATFSQVFMCSAAPIAIVSFMIMLSLAIHPPSAESAITIGWIGTVLDDVATFLIIGASPFILSISGKDDWVPGWLVWWGYLAGIAGLVSIVGMLIGVAAIGFFIIPFGIGWMIAAGVVLIKKK
ncbi:MAG: hypothetical protein IPL55_12515 [Saprospiraceae bacterium]|jgi:hypothetical protein|nr:hypothetical protein [Saprospiraceae bacterium]